MHKNKNDKIPACVHYQTQVVQTNSQEGILILLPIIKAKMGILILIIIIMIVIIIYPIAFWVHTWRRRKILEKKISGLLYFCETDQSSPTLEDFTRAAGGG